ncbi:hypothetical protein CR513_59652, partial [Mucuna pruriens]
MKSIKKKKNRYNAAGSSQESHPAIHSRLAIPKRFPRRLQPPTNAERFCRRQVLSPPVVQLRSISSSFLEGWECGQDIAWKEGVLLSNCAFRVVWFLRRVVSEWGKCIINVDVLGEGSVLTDEVDALMVLPISNICPLACMDACWHIVFGPIFKHPLLLDNHGKQFLTGMYYIREHEYFKMFYVPCIRH